MLTSEQTISQKEFRYGDVEKDALSTHGTKQILKEIFSSDHISLIKHHLGIFNDSPSNIDIMISSAIG